MVSPDAKTLENRAVLDAALRDLDDAEVLYSCAGTEGSLIIKRDGLRLLSPPRPVEPPANNRQAAMITSDIVAITWQQVVRVSYVKDRNGGKATRRFRVTYETAAGQQSRDIEIDSAQARAALDLLPPHLPPEKLGHSNTKDGIALLGTSLGTTAPVLFFFVLTLLGIETTLALVAAGLAAGALNVLPRLLR